MFNICQHILLPEWKVKGRLGSLMQPLSMVATVMTADLPQGRSVREQLVPFEVQVWFRSSTAEGIPVATYRSACGAAFQVTWPTLATHCRDT